jgi:hypothetical protein
MLLKSKVFYAAMANLSPNQRAKLEALWRSMPAQMRASLQATARVAAEADASAADLVAVFDDLEESLNPAAGDLAKPYFFTPLRPLTAEPGRVPPSRFRFTAEDLSKLWGWLGRVIAKDVIEGARKCRKQDTDPAWHEMRREAAAHLSEAITRAHRVPKDMTALVKMFGDDGGDMLADAAILLKYSEEVEGAMAQIPGRIPDLDEDLCYRLKTIHEGMVEAAPEAAVWVLLLTMGRLENPWEIFRAVEKIGRRGDDLVVSKTELAAVGDAVLGDTGYYASLLKTPPATMDEAKKAFEVFDQYVAFSTGMTKEFGIRKDGRWGRSLFGLRAEASTNVEKIFEKVPLALDSGLPEPRRGRSGRVIPAQLPNDAAIERAEGLLFFLAKARDHANAAAVASSQKRQIEEAQKRLAEAGGMLVDLVADSEGQNREAAKDGLEITARLMEAAEMREEASLLRRRGVAAATAA